jgi:hypothetical protein
MKLTVLLIVLVFLILVWFTHKEPTVVIVTSHWKEDLTWLKKSKYPVVLIDHEGSEPPAIKPTTIIPNRGNESSSYIRYIIDNWDNLPDYVAFIHGHETAHHQKHKEHMLTLIDRAQRSGFVTLNGMWLGEPAPSNVKRDYYLQIAKYWYLFEPYMKKYPNKSLFTDACGQFIVSKDEITKYPLKAWQTWYEALIHPDTHQELGFVFEYTWHYIFGQPWQMKRSAFPFRKRFPFVF